MPDRLNEDELRSRLTGLDHWTVEGGKLRQEFKFGNFVEAFAFMTAAALEAEKLDHHPEWSNVYNRVTVDLVTHSADGITELDLALAEIMNGLAAATRR